MGKFVITHGLGGGFSGGIVTEVIEESSLQAAMDEAERKSIEDYESYEGMYGLRTTQEIMEEDEVDLDEAEIIYEDERDGWLDYNAVEFDPTNKEHLELENE